VTPKPDYAASLAFLRKFAPDGLWVLTAITPSKDRTTTTASFSAKEEKECLEWLTKQGAKKNIYFSVNPVRERMSKKAAAEDIANMSWLHVDVDPRAGEDLKAEQQRILGLFKELPKGVPQPTVVVFSGGGFQGFWRLQEPVPINGELAKYESAKLYNVQIELMFGADSCHNVDRIMRLPGTINRPDERKRAKGRVEALTEVVYFTDAVYPISAFTPAAPVQSKDDKGFSGGVTTLKIAAPGNIRRLASLDELGTAVPNYCKVVIAQGKDPDNPNKYASRSDAVWYVVCELVRANVPDDTIFSVLTDPGWQISGHILDQRNPEKSALRQIARAHEFAIDPKLLELNERHAIVEDVGGKCRIIGEVSDGVLNNRTRLSFQSVSDFRIRYLNRTIEVAAGSGSTVKVNLGEWWLRHANRRQYDTIVFAPEMDVNGSYNLWKGFAYAARPGVCDKFLAHVRENICAGDEGHYRYLMGWMASAVQKPASPGHTAVVLRGTQGTGKSFFVKTFGKLFGRHFLQVADPKHLVGSFNSHLRDCVVLFGDEAFYAGDKKHESVLKMLVTEETITIEAKGVDATASPNFVHLLMASNDEWVVPAGFHERRFFVLDVGTVHRQDNSYFQTIQEELDAGGYEAFLYLLRTYDLTGYNVRALPQTKGLLDQKLLSYTGEKDWWYQKLLAGEILPGKGWPEYVYTMELTEDFASHTRRYNMSSRGNATRLGLFLRSAMPKGHEFRGRLHGIQEVRTAPGQTEKIDRPYVYLLPGLDVCRKIWDDKFGGPFPWPKALDVKTHSPKADTPF
jgi:hypothetical protein